MSAWQHLIALPFTMWGNRPQAINLETPAAKEAGRRLGAFHDMWCGRASKAPTPTKHQNCRKTKAIWLLVRQGTITLREIANLGDNSPSKTVLRMRLDGVLFADAFDPKGFRMAPNASGQGGHKVYLWTNKLPAGLERRKVKRP